MSDLDRRIERQGAAVAKLARQLQFERLMLQRLRQRAGARGKNDPAEAAAGHMRSIVEVYAAALLRQIEADALGDVAAEPDL